MASLSLTDLLSEKFGGNPVKAKFDDIYNRQTTAALGSKYYEKYLGREYYMPVTLDGQLLPPPIVRVSCQKKIVETPLAGRKGSVIEQISIDSYKIDIKGVIFTKDGSYPEEDLTKLCKLWEKNESLVIRSVLTDIFLTTPGTKDAGDIDKVVITSFSPEPTEGKTGRIFYQMELKQDYNLQLILP